MKPERDWLLDDLEALKNEPVPEAALAAVRARVASEVEVRSSEPRAWWRWAWVPGLAAAAVFVVMISRPNDRPEPRRIEETRVVAPPTKTGMDPVAAVVAKASEPVQKKGNVVPVTNIRGRKNGNVVPVTDFSKETQFVKLITDDPDVVIYWAMEGTE